MTTEFPITIEAIPVAGQAVFADVIDINKINDDGSVDSSVADETRLDLGQVKKEMVEEEERRLKRRQRNAQAKKRYGSGDEGETATKKTQRVKRSARRKIKTEDVAEAIKVANPAPEAVNLGLMWSPFEQERLWTRVTDYGASRIPLREWEVIALEMRRSVAATKRQYYKMLNAGGPIIPMPKIVPTSVENFEVDTNGTIAGILPDPAIIEKSILEVKEDNEKDAANTLASLLTAPSSLENGKRTREESRGDDEGGVEGEVSEGLEPPKKRRKKSHDSDADKGDSNPSDDMDGVEEAVQVDDQGMEDAAAEARGESDEKGVRGEAPIRGRMPIKRIALANAKKNDPKHGVAVRKINGYGLTPKGRWRTRTGYANMLETALIDHERTWWELQRLRFEKRPDLGISLQYPGANLPELTPFLMRNFKDELNMELVKNRNEPKWRKAMLVQLHTNPRFTKVSQDDDSGNPTHARNFARFVRSGR